MAHFARIDENGVVQQVVVVDNLMDVATDGGEEFASMRAIMKELKYLARATNSAVVVLHHTSEAVLGTPCQPRSARANSRSFWAATRASSCFLSCRSWKICRILGSPPARNDRKVLIMVSTGETAQSAVGLQTDALYAININAIEIACGSAQLAPASPLYDGGGASSSSPTNRIDGRFAIRPFGEYQQNDIFASGSSRVYDGPGDFIIRYDTALTPDAWTIERIISTGPTVYEVEYKQVVADEDGLNSLMVSDIQNPIGRDPDNANISGASFPTSQVFEIGQLDPGRNNAKRCRIRSEAMFMTVAADGRPWSVERMSAVLAQVGKSRGGS